MFLVRFLWWLITLPVRLVLFVVGVAFWVLTLPLRLVFALLALIGLGRVLQFAVVSGIGYCCYRLVSDELEAPSPQTEAERRDTLTAPPPPAMTELRPAASA